MKKIFIIFFIIFFSPQMSSGDTQRITLRAARHPEFLRIVVQGPESVISGAIVNQREHNIQVTFPQSVLSIKEEKVVVAYKKISDDSILFYPLEFRGFKAFTLKYPSRLVIDVFLKKEKDQERKAVTKSREKKIEKRSWKARERKKEEGIKRTEIKKKSSGVTTVVIDSGHGGYEYGIANDQYIEKNAVLDIAKKLKSRIGRGKTRCYLTRGSDRFLDLNERAQIVNEKGAEVFISLHVGNHDNIVLYVPVISDSVPDLVRPFLVNRGQEDFMTESLLLMKSIQHALVEDFGDDIVLVKPLPYSLLSKVEAAAIMIEFPSFDYAYYGSEFRTDMVNTIYKGLYLYEEKTARWD